MSQSFSFKQFSIQQDQCAMKVGTDGVLLGAWPSVRAHDKVLDIGAGTGLIALMLAQKQATSAVIGIEIDKIAAQQASENVANSPFADRVQIQAISIQDYADLAGDKFDLIVSNPPFFTGGVLSDNMQRRQVRHTVKLSHNDLLRSVQRLLKDDGRFCVVLPWLEGLRFQELAASYQLYTTRKCIISPRPDSSPNRLLLQLERKEKAVEENSMSIYAHESGEERSAAFKSLTADYYLKL